MKILAYALEHPTHGAQRVANELCLQNVNVGVGGWWAMSVIAVASGAAQTPSMFAPVSLRRSPSATPAPRWVPCWKPSNMRITRARDSWVLQSSSDFFNRPRASSHWPAM